MTISRNPFRRLFNPIHPIPAGMYHYQSPPEDPRNYHLHLRLEQEGGGILVVNASTILHLNKTAAEYAYYLVQNTPPRDVATLMSARYHVSKDEARKDYADLAERIQVLVETPDLDPATFLDFERQPPHSGSLSAPYRLDCALTYRLPSDEAPDNAPIERVARELNTAEWVQILDKAWAAGIPHIVFTGGEPTLRDDLPDLIAHTQEIGQVSGVLTEGQRLADELYLGRLLKAGLDHLMIVLHPEEEWSWQAVGNAMVEDLAVAVHYTLDPETRGASVVLDRLVNMGVKQVSLSASDEHQGNSLLDARNQAAYRGLELVWNLPVPYSAFHPVAMEVEDAQIEGAGRAWLYLEPDGDVLPSQGIKKVLGNFLRDDWHTIWKG
jgi:hypothetical protein